MVSLKAGVAGNDATPVQHSSISLPSDQRQSYASNLDWSLPSLHDIGIELNTRRFAQCPHKQCVFAASDCVYRLEHTVSNSHILFAELPIDLTPEQRSFPVNGLPVDLCLGPVTGSMGLRYLSVFFEYGAREVETHILENNRWYHTSYKAHESLGVAA